MHLTLVAGPDPHPNLTFRPAARGDVVFELEGIPFVVDPYSRPVFRQATLDHVIEEGFASFQIDGPFLPQRQGEAVDGSRLSQEL